MADRAHVEALGRSRDRSAETARLEAKVIEQGERLAAAERQLAEERRQAAVREARVRNLGVRLDRIRMELDSTLRDRDLAIQAARAELQGLIDQLALMRASTSWRVTRPLRALQSLRLRLTRESAPRPSLGIPVPETDPTPGEPPTAPASPGRPPLDPLEDAVASSGFFDESFYSGTAAALAAGIDPVVHYLREGEAAGVAPSALFDPVFYAARHDDLRGADLGGLRHYVAFGHQEGRAARPAAATLAFPTDRLAADKSTVVIAVSAASRARPPRLAQDLISGLRANDRNVVVLLFRDGPVAPAIDALSNAMVVVPETFVFHPAEINALVAALIHHYAPDYLVADGVDTRYFVSAFERAGLPVVALVHEFASTARPRGSLDDLFQSATSLVFPARIVAEAALADYPVLAARRFDVLPPGASPMRSDGRTAIATPPYGDDRCFLVVGIGAITPRAGVEFFIAAAAETRRCSPLRPIRFVWFGEADRSDEPYFDDLQEQVKRAGVASLFSFAQSPDDLEPVHARADLMFLSARLDQPPNFAIDAAMRGVPVACFDQASVLAEILNASPDTRELVVPYSDVAAAARLIAALADDPARRAAFADAIQAIARETFGLARYVARVDAFGRAAAEAAAQARRDAALIAREGGFNRMLFLGAAGAMVPDREAIARYVHASRLAVPRDRPRVGMLVRRPLEGFHPLIFAGEGPGFEESSGEDPLAHFLRTGQPLGRWTHRVIRPAAHPVAASEPRVAVHGHFHYPELLEDLVPRLRKNRQEIDLLLTTTSDARAGMLAAIIERMGVARATITVVPNRGRDIGPVLTDWGRSRFQEYDLVGHVHGKRSPQFDPAIGDGWRAFLLERLIGGDHAMMDTIAAAFHADPSLGLVFPEDPHLNDWDDNRAIADELARRMRLPMPLPTHFDFPIGTMFWSRPAALKPLWDLDLGWDDFPPEPLPIDGALPHALERLLPFAASQGGYGHATTHIDGHPR